MSSFDPRSPGYYGTTTYSSISDGSDSDTPRASTDSSASPGLIRRVAFSPPSHSETSFEGHSHDDSFGEHAEVEAVLTELDLDTEINATQDAVSQWSSSRPSYTSFSTSTPYSGTGSYTGTSASYSADTATATGTYFTRDPRVLSTISERTEHPSRPTSFAQNRLSAHRLSTISNPHARSPIEPPENTKKLSTHSQGHTRGATDLPTTSRRTGDLIAFFEDRAGTPSKEKERNTSPFLPTTQSTPHLGSTTGYTSTGYGYTTGLTSTGYGYTTGTGTGGYTTTGYTTSRPTSATKSRSDDSRSTVSTSSGGGGTDLSLSSLLSPPIRGFGTPTGTYSGSGTATGKTQLSPSDFASTFSSAFGVARGRQDDTTPTRQTQTALRRSTAALNEPNTSPRSPLTSVRNIVAAWKERTPGLGKVKSESSEGGLSPPGASKMEGLFSLRRRASRQGPRGQPPVTPDRNGGKSNVGGSNRNRENEGITNSGDNVIRRRVSSTSSLIPPPFDMTDLGEERTPIRIGTLWYLNVHSPTPYRWQKCSALLYPHVLILSWSAPGGGRGVVSLDLINCTEVRSTPGFTHPGARGDVGGVSAAAQMTEDGVSLVEVLCPFQLLYGDGVERLAAESARERVRWVSAIWEALDRSLSLPSRSQSGSPTGSIGTIHSMASTTSTSAGSRSTVFVPPLHTIPSLSDLGSDSGGLSLSASRVPSVGGHGRTADDSSYLYPSDPRIIAPSRSSSLRRTSSLTDLDEEFASAVSRARSAKPGLGFGLSLVNESLSSESGGILGVGGGSPVTVSSGPRLGGDVRVTPPPTGKTRNRALSVSEEEFFSAGSRTSSSRPESDFFSADSSRTSRSGDGRTTTGLVTDGTAFEFTSGESNTQIVPSTLSYRRTESNSYLGDSHDGSGSYTPYTSSDSRSRTPFSASDSRSRTPYSYSSSGYTSSMPYTYTSGSYAPTSISPSLSRTPEIRRRRYGAYSTSDEPSDRENYTTTRSTLSGWTRSRTPTTTTEGFLAVEERDSSGSEGYTTAHASPSPSTASFKSLPTIPSESDYQTLDTCKTCVSSEYVTAERCASDVETEYVTAEKCKTETETDFWTAEVCKSDKEETQYETASVCLTIPSEEGLSTPRSGLVVELPAEEPIDELIDEPTGAPIVESIDVRVDVPVDEPIEVPIEASVDEPVDVPTEAPVDVPIEVPVDVHIEAPADVPIEAFVDVPIGIPLTCLSKLQSTCLLKPPSTYLLKPPSTCLFKPPSMCLLKRTSKRTSKHALKGTFKRTSTFPSIVSEESALEVSITPEAVTAQEEIVEDDSLLESAPPTTEAPETPIPIVSVHTDSSFSYTESDLSPAQPELDTSISTLTESTEPFVVATPRTVQTPVLSISDHDEEAVTPSVHPSQWPSETDVSFDSSALQPTPSMQSAVLQEGIDGSFETSFMRPSVSPLSSIARLTPITETISSLTPSPRQVFPPLELVSSPSSGPTPLTMSTSASSSLSRTASTVSGVSSIAIEAEEEDAVSVRAASDISTVPSLLSTRSEESVRYMPMPSPRAVPLPVSPAPTSVSMSVSVTTPHDDVPSIHSILETEDTRTHTHTHTEQTITHDIDRLIHHIQEIDQFRGQETQEIAENVRAIRDELYDLSEYVRTRLVVERPPAVPTRDMSVGGSSVLSTPRGPRPRPGIPLVEMSPPPMRPSSPSSPSSVMSFLSSHHSDDDLSLLETELEAETVERSYSISREPSWPSSSSSSRAIPGPSLSATSSSSPTPPPSSPTPPPSSPTPSTASATTVRQRDSITIETLRDMLTSLREQMTALWENQVSTNRVLDELHQTRSGPLDTTEFNDRFRAIEVLLRQLIDRRVETERPVHIQPPSESISDVGTDVDAEDFQQRWQDWTRLLRDRVPLAAPQPRRARGNLDDELLALLQAPPPQVPIGVQPPPALIPFAYQPAVRPPRSRSTSPIVRSSTFPIATGPVVFSPEIQHPPFRRIRGRRDGRGPREPPIETETVLSGAPRRPPQPTVPPPGVFSDPARPRPSTHIPPLNLSPSAPANLEPSDDPRPPQTWYLPRRSDGLGMPPPPVIPGQQGDRRYVPMPPGPEHRLAQLATVDQQRELMRYMRGLNEWLERDVQDRQAELRGVTARVDELRNDLARLGLGMQPGVQPLGVQPPGVHPMPVGPIPPPLIFGPGPPGFVPGESQSLLSFLPLEVLLRQTSIVLSYPMNPDGPGRACQNPIITLQHVQYEHRPGDEDEPVIPTSPPHSGSGDVLPTRPYVPEHTIIVQQSDTEGSDASTDTQQTYAPHHVQHPPESPIFQLPGDEHDIPAVVHSGEHTHSRGSPQPLPLRPAPPPQVDMADQPRPMQPSPDEPLPIQYAADGFPPPPVFPDPGPVVIHPPVEYRPDRSRSRSRSSSGRNVVVIQQSPPHHSPRPDPLPLRTEEHVPRSPARQESVGVTPLGGDPVVTLPASRGHVSRSRSRSRSPRRSYGYGYPHDPHYGRGRYPYGRDYGRDPYDSPDYYRRRPYGRDYGRDPYDSPDYYRRRPYGRHRHEDYYPEDRDRWYSRTPPRRYGEDDRRRSPPHRHRDSPSSTRPTERDPSRRDDPTSSHRRPSDTGHHTQTQRSPTELSEADPGHRRPSDTGHHTQTRRSPTELSEADPDSGHHIPSHHTPGRSRTPSHRHPTPGLVHHTPSHGIPDSPRIEDAPRSPTVIRIEPERYESPGRQVIIGPGDRPFSRGMRVADDVQGAPVVSFEMTCVTPPMFPTIHSSHPPPVAEHEGGHRSPFAMDDDRRHPSRHPSRRGTPSATEHDGGHRSPFAMDDDRQHPSRHPSHRTPSVMEHEGGRRSPSAMGDDRYRPPSARDDEADPYGSRDPSRVPSRTRSRVEHMPAAIEGDDDGRHESGIVQVPPPVVHVHPPAHDGQPPYRSPSVMDDHGRHRPPPVRDDEADPYGSRGPSRVPSRTGSRAGGMPAVIQDDGSRHESGVVHVPVHDPHVQFDPTTTGFDDALNQRHERLDEVERELNQVVQDAHEAENRREAEFRHSEEERENIFLQNEDRREAEARQRSDALFAELEERAHSVPPLPVPPPPGSGDNASIIESIHTASQEAASRYASDILETVRLEREQAAHERESFAAERDQERAEFAAERTRIDEERERRVRDLEEELARVRGELEGERQLRQTENEERAAANERDEGMRAQLGDITQLVSEQRDECTRKRELMDQRWEEKQGRRAEKDAQFHELKDMVSRLIQDREADRIQEEERRLREEGKPDIQVVLDELTRQNNEMREALRALSEDWQIEGERRHEHTLEAVRATAREQVPFNVQVYLDEFSKALATEVRMLLGEVGKLREERRNIQHELGYLMMMKAKYGPGGEFDPDWKPPMPGPGGPDVPPPPEAPPPPPEEPGPARPAWRTLPRSTRRIRKPRPDQPPPPEPGPAPIRQPVHSWVTWHPNPALAPTPPSIEPNLIVPDQGSPGLFGPRSPRSYR
ncbi:hypothetical protein BDR07DRAFT_1480198 [Suillus spraguei]|nr:hypothetical protein BDR07DRAFT_1480198 [Suillus spraguei]